MALTVRYNPARLREIMHEEKLTQEELGAAIGRSQSHIARLCRGEFCASLRMCYLIARALGRGVEDVFPPDPSWFVDTRGEPLAWSEDA